MGIVFFGDARLYSPKVMVAAWYIGIILVLSAFAFVAAILGIGGGTLFTPVQLFFGLDIHGAAATSLFLTMVLSAGANFVYRQARLVDWRMALVLQIPSIPGGFLGGYFSRAVSGHILVIILIAVMIVSGIAILSWSPFGHGGIRNCLAWYHWKRSVGKEQYALNVLLALPVSFVAGFVSAMVGIGGGVMMVPLMAMLFSVPIDIVIATSSLMAGMMAVGGFTGHALAGNWDLRLSAILAPGILAGSLLGAKGMLRMGKPLLTKVFGASMIVLAVCLAVRMWL